MHTVKANFMIADRDEGYIVLNGERTDFCKVNLHHGDDVNLQDLAKDSNQYALYEAIERKEGQEHNDLLITFVGEADYSTIPEIKGYNRIDCNFQITTVFEDFDTFQAHWDDMHGDEEDE